MGVVGCHGEKQEERREMPTLGPRLGTNDANELDQHKVLVLQITDILWHRPLLLHCKK